MAREGTQVVRSWAHPRRSADATEPEDGSPLYIWSHRHAVDQLGVDAGRCDPRYRREEDMIDIGGYKTGLAERGFDGFFAEIGRAFDPLVVHLRERIECAVILHRERQMTSANTDRAMQPLEASVAFVAPVPFFPKRRGNHFLRIVVLR